MVKKVPSLTPDNLHAPLPETLVDAGIQTGPDTTAAKAAESAPDPFAHVGDPHWGQGGRYIVVDGQRVPAPLTDDTEATHG